MSPLLGMTECVGFSTNFAGAQEAYSSKHLYSKTPCISIRLFGIKWCLGRKWPAGARGPVSSVGLGPKWSVGDQGEAETNYPPGDPIGPGAAPSTLAAGYTYWSGGHGWR